MIKIKCWRYRDEEEVYALRDYYIDPLAVTAIGVEDEYIVNSDDKVVGLIIRFHDDTDKIRVCASQNVDQIISDVIRAKGYPARSVRKEAV